MTPPGGRFDPRWYQIAVLGSLLFYGLFFLDFDIRAGQVAITLATALLTQYLCTRLWKLPVYDPRSALISGLSLCLLLRTSNPGLVVVCGAITIASKFLLRIRAKHIFNPTNFGIVVMLLLTEQVWVSPGQWGSGAFFGFLMACAGGLVVNRAARSDVTFSFLLTYMGLVAARSVWLGEPVAIPLHRFQSGALLLFAFFMISDPKTTPDSRIGRALFAVLVAAGRVVRPVQAVPDERPAVVTGRLFPHRAGDRLAAARRSLRLAGRGASGVGGAGGANRANGAGG